MIESGPKPFAGLEIIAHELDRQMQINSELMTKNQELEQRIQVLEKLLDSYMNSSSGSNNAVLLWSKYYLSC